MDEKFVEDAISNLKEQLEHCNSINEYLDLVYSFNFRDLTINPFQIKNEIATLLKILKLKKSKIVLEIGTAKGGTLFLFSKVCPPDMTLISIDLPEGPFGGEFFPDWKIPFYKSFATQQQKIHIIRADSQNSKTLDEIKVLLNGKKIDFLFIDGNHRYESVKKDFELYGEFLSDDGIIALHDISSGPEENVGAVPKFWKEIKSKHESLEILDNDNTLGYGIGLLFPNETKIQSREYVRILKTVLKNQNSVIQKIEKQLNEEIKKLVEKTPYEIQTHKKKVLDISQNLQEKEAEITNGKDYISKLKNDLEEKEAEITIGKDYTSKLKNDLQEKEAEFSKNQEYASKITNDLQAKESEISKVKEYVSKLVKEISDKNEEIKKLEGSLDEIKENLRILVQNRPKYYSNRL